MKPKESTSKKQCQQEGCRIYIIVTQRGVAAVLISVPQRSTLGSQLLYRYHIHTHTHCQTVPSRSTLLSTLLDPSHYQCARKGRTQTSSCVCERIRRDRQAATNGQTDNQTLNKQKSKQLHYTNKPAKKETYKHTKNHCICKVCKFVESREVVAMLMCKQALLAWPLPKICTRDYICSVGLTSPVRTSLMRDHRNISAS